jgi:hypothetical protein
MFGEARLLAAMRSSPHPLQNIKQALQLFIGNRVPDDDVSLVTLHIE